MTWRVLRHPRVADDLLAIARLVADYAGPDSARRKIDEIEKVVRSLSATPHRGSLRDHITPGLRAIPAGRRGVVVFVVDDARRHVRVLAISYGGADWARRAVSRW